MTAWTIPAIIYLIYLDSHTNPSCTWPFYNYVTLYHVLLSYLMKSMPGIVTEIKIKLKPISSVLFSPHNCNILEKYSSGCGGLIFILVYLFSKPVCIFETSSVFLKYCTVEPLYNKGPRYWHCNKYELFCYFPLSN